MANADWQPIETAPKNGEQVLLCQATDKYGHVIHPRDFGVHVQVAYWVDGEDEKEDGGEWVVYFDATPSLQVDFTPSHWMPLPELPAK